MVKFNKIKDRTPEETIRKCKSILDDLGITVKEKWFKSADCFFSVCLCINESNVGVNGKGSSPDYALASGYGELLERLQNQYLIFPHFPFHLVDEEERKFYFCPDEVWGNFEVFKTSFYKLYPVLDMSYEFIFEKLVNAQQKTKDGNLLMVPFDDILTNEKYLIPKVFLDLFPGSNGMCSGNSKSEAIVQGLSEIAERFVIRESFNSSYEGKSLEQNQWDVFFPDVVPLLEKLSSRKGVDVYVLDYSKDFNLPVLGVVYIDKVKHKYLVNHGSHPNIQVALERCLTELLQGQELDEFDYLIDFEPREEICSEVEDLKPIFLDRRGNYPFNFFKFDSIQDVNIKVFSSSVDNSVLEKSLCSLFIQQNKKILVRDCSFLGFNSYQILVPGISELFHLNRRNLFVQTKNLAFKNEILQSVNEIANNIPVEIKDYSEEICKASFDSVIRLPLCKPSPIGKLPVVFLNIWSALIQKDFRRACDLLDNLLEKNRTSNEYLKTVVQILKKSSLHSCKEIMQVYKLFYDDYDDLIDTVLSGRIIGVPFFNCPNCNSCLLNDICKGKVFFELQKKLDDLYINFMVSKNGCQ